MPTTKTQPNIEEWVILNLILFTRKGRNSKAFVTYENAIKKRLRLQQSSKPKRINAFFYISNDNHAQNFLQQTQFQTKRK